MLSLPVIPVISSSGTTTATATPAANRTSKRKRSITKAVIQKKHQRQTSSASSTLYSVQRHQFFLVFVFILLSLISCTSRQASSSSSSSSSLTFWKRIQQRIITIRNSSSSTRSNNTKKNSTTTNEIQIGRSNTTTAATANTSENIIDNFYGNNNNNNNSTRNENEVGELKDSLFVPSSIDTTDKNNNYDNLMNNITSEEYDDGLSPLSVQQQIDILDWNTNNKEGSKDDYNDKDDIDDDDDDVTWMVFDNTKIDNDNYNDDDDDGTTSKKGKRRRQFFDRISILSSTIMRREFDASMLPTERLVQLKEKLRSISSMNQQQKPVLLSDEELNAITPQSDVSLPGRYIHIVTTAALPWMTGTSVNPLLRAAYLHRKTQEINNQYENQKQEHIHYHQDKKSYVTLVIPWLELQEDQNELYNGRIFQNTVEQEEYIRTWLREDAKMMDAADDLEILFYPARYHAGLRSIFAMGDIMDVIPKVNRDVCVLEEPEHCNWYRAPGYGWTSQFNYVIGVVHTNYKEYALSHYSGLWTAPAIQLMSAAMVRAYCHKVIKLSSVLQSYAPEKEATENVHGVRSEFIDIGLQRSQQQVNINEDEIISTAQVKTKQVYFIGKLLWAKGLDIMLELEDYYKQCSGEYFAIDIYGSGPDQKSIVKAFHGSRSYNNNNNKDKKRKKKDEEMIRNKVDIEETELSSTSSSLNITLALGGGTQNPDEDETSRIISTTTTNDNNNNNGISTLPTLESLQVKAKESIAKVKETINSVEIPKSLSEFRRQPIPATFPGRVDHAVLKEYKIFLNPSVSEVLCTTTAEALAMGKFVIIPDHPSNKFFLRFPNCLAYRNKFEFAANLRWALSYDPEPLTPELARHLSWEAATDRFMAASAVTYREALERERLGRQKLDERIAWFHNEIGKGTTGDMLRKLLGAGPVSRQVEYQKQTQSSSSSLSSSSSTILTLKKTDERKEDSDNDDDEEDEDDGLSSKFRRSAFARALQATLSDISSFVQ